MLEFLGFIALLAIIFGVSFATALAGFFKVILIGVLIIVAIGIIAKMLETKSGVTFILVASTLATLLGVIMINDNLNNRYLYCFKLTDNYLYSSCMLNAVSGHNEAVNKGWGYAIVGGIVLFVSGVSWSEKKEQEKKKASPRKR